MKLLKDNIYVFSRNNNNAYLIKEEDAVLIDGVECEFGEEYISAVKEIIPFEKIKYIVINHCEGNRAGTINAVLKENPDIKVIASTAGLKFLKRICDMEFSEILAKDNMTLNDRGDLRFLLTPNINWPDSMLTIYKGNLFSSDLFGTVDGDMLKYSDEHLYGREEYVKSAIIKLSDFNIDTIYQGSGIPIGTKDIPDVMYFSKKKNNDILILYSSLYGNTEEMAKTVYKTFCDNSVNTKLLDINKFSTEEIAKHIDNCLALVVGTNTVNADAPEKMWEIFAKSDKLLNKRKPCMIFGSYGWSGEGAYYLEKYLKLLRYNVFEKPYLTAFKMNEEEKKELKSLTENFIEFLYSCDK